MYVKLHHGRLSLRQRIHGRYVTIKSVGYPIDMDECRSKLTADEMADVFRWVDRHRSDVEVRTMPTATTTIAPVYAEHIVLALEAIRGMALSVLLQPHLLASHRERILRACRDLAQQTQTDVEDDVVVVTDVPDGAPSCQNPLV